MNKLFVAVMMAGVLALAGCGATGGMKQPSTAPADDETIAIRVRTSLLNAPDVHANEVQVEVAGAVVTLKGAVHGEPEMNAAIAAARKVAGVRDVKSAMTSKQPSE